MFRVFIFSLPYLKGHVSYCRRSSVNFSQFNLLLNCWTK